MKKLTKTTVFSYDEKPSQMYLCSDVDPMIRELRAQVLVERAGGWHFYEQREHLRKLERDKGALRRRRIYDHYANLIRSGKPGWWQHD